MKFEQTKGVPVEDYTKSPYYEAYIKAQQERFGRQREVYQSEIVSTTATAPRLAITRPAWRKRTVIMVIVLVLSLLVVAFAALSYFNVIEDIGSIFGLNTLEDMVQGTIDWIESAEGWEILDIITPILLYASIVMALIMVILSIVALASKTKIYLFIPALIMLLLGLASGACFVINYMEIIDVVELLNPANLIALQYGYYIIVGLQLLTFIFSLFAYKKIARRI